MRYQLTLSIFLLFIFRINSVPVSTNSSVTLTDQTNKESLLKNQNEDIDLNNHSTTLMDSKISAFETNKKIDSSEMFETAETGRMKRHHRRSGGHRGGGYGGGCGGGCGSPCGRPCGRPQMKPMKIIVQPIIVKPIIVKPMIMHKPVQRPMCYHPHCGCSHCGK